MSDSVSIRQILLMGLGSFIGATAYTGCHSVDATETIGIGAVIGAYVAVPIGLGLLTWRRNGLLSAFFWALPVLLVLTLLVYAFAIESNEGEPYAVFFTQTTLAAWIAAAVVTVATRRKAGSEAE